MSLRLKFAVLMALLGLSVAACAAAAMWSFVLLERNLRAPIASMSASLEHLRVIKRAGEEATGVLNPGWSATPGGPARWGDDPTSSPQPAPGAQERLEAVAARVGLSLARLDEEPFGEMRVGRTALRDLRRRATESHALAQAWAHTADPEARSRALVGLFELHELIEAAEGRILQDWDLTLEEGERLRQRLAWVVGWAVVVAGLSGVLGVTLVGRWVLAPVRLLRDAAARIAAGDFDHRVVPMARDELGALTREVNHMAGMVRALQDERVERELLAAVGEMVRRLAHNLRNPLAGIRGLAEITRDELTPGSDAREAQDRIIHSVDRFEGWLKELLSATSPMRVDPESTAIEPWIGGLVGALRPMGEVRGVRVSLAMEPGAPAEAVFDARQLEHAVSAILTNAIQVTPSGVQNNGSAEVRISIEADGPNGWQVRIEDHGPGVPEDVRARIFQPYFTTKKDGNGIGLAIAQQVVRAHGGRIDVESPRNGLPGHEGGGAGAAFVVRLPRVAAAEDSMRARESPSGAAGGQNSNR